MSIRRVLTVVLGGTVTLAIAAAVALIVLTSELRETADDLRLSLEGVHLAEALQVELLQYARTHDAVMESGEDGAPPGRESLMAIVAQMARHAATEREQALVDVAIARTQWYLSASHAALTRDGRSPALDAAADEALQDALETLTALTTSNLDQAQRATDRARRSNRAANVIGLSVAAVLAVVVPGALIWVAAAGLRPLLLISETMRNFGTGQRRARLPALPAEELQQISTSFNEMAEALSAQQERQLAFVAAVAHDLRTPLQALSLATAIDPATERPENVQAAFHLVKRQTSRLDRMVSDLMDACRIEAGQLDLWLRRCDLREPLGEAVNLHLHASPRHCVELSAPEEAVHVTCDPLRLEQVFNNLVGNAIKYSPDGGVVRVALVVDRGLAVVSIADQGIGIPASALSDIFRPFQRAPGIGHEIPGAGLGLSVARRIIEAHQGRIGVSSREGHGATFEVRLPLA